MGISAKNKFVSPEFLAGSVEFPPLPVHLDTRAAEYISVVFFLSCVSRIIPFKGTGTVQRDGSGGN